ncbi:MAG: Gfo/Idh/MocA family protein [Gemmatimonadales bacterium]
MRGGRLRWGVLGTASIAIRRVIPALQASWTGDVVAVASRDRARAECTALAAGVPRAFGSYQELLDDATIDAVYIPLPNHLHVPWSVKALEAGKHVLCEKPIGVSGADAQLLLQAAAAHPGLTVMEAFMYRCHPRWQRVRQLVVDGAVGEIGSVHTMFSYDNRDPGNIRNVAAMGGGAWLDIGCYGVSVARFLFGIEPIAVDASQQIDPVFGIDRLTSAVLDFGSGTATVICATQLAPHQAVSIHGTRGRIELELPFNPPSGQPTVIHLYRDGTTQEIMVEPCDQFQLQADRFADAALNGVVAPVSLDDSLANMAALDRGVPFSGRQPTNEAT